MASAERGQWDLAELVTRAFDTWQNAKLGDCHVPYVGTAEDGRRFFLTEELFYADGTYVISIEPGDFICYCAPWDGYDYDT